MENNTENNRQKALKLFFVVAAFSAVGLGLSDAVFSNYFKEAYNVTAFQRGLIEFPRETPGIICVFVVSALAFLGDIRISIIAQALSIIGLVVLGFITPPFAVMLIFLFINSAGMHIFMPLQDSICMSLQGGKNVGSGLGKLKSFGLIFSVIASIIVFFGFRSGIFTFTDGIISIFLLAAVAFCITLVLLMRIDKLTRNGQTARRHKIQLVFKKKYNLYYILSVCNGAQKQIRIVYGPWVLIELLGKRADTLAILGIAASLISIFFIRFVGWMLDKCGNKRSIFIQAVSFITVYMAYALLSYGFYSGSLAKAGFPLAAAFVVFVLDRMTQNFTMVNAVYLRSIAEKPADITPSLTVGLGLDHIVAIICAFIGGIVWSRFGPHYVFIFTAALSIVNIVISYKIKEA
ncbi:MAG: MFS transporter [Clostridiales bacterium]|nr:MFS transporter [Clostridiales bacterium]